MGNANKAKCKTVLPNGRSAKSLPKFDNWHCRIFPKDITYPAWKHLSKTATDVANICRAKSDRAAFSKLKGECGRPVFDFTATEAEKVFSITRPTFNSALKALIKIGFIEVYRHGGICDGKGIAALYKLSERWKVWEPPQRDNTNILKARAARKKSKGPG